MIIYGDHNSHRVASWEATVSVGHSDVSNAEFDHPLTDIPGFTRVSSALPACVGTAGDVRGFESGESRDVGKVTR